MRIGRFSYKGQVFTGQLGDDGIVYPLTGEIYKEIRTANYGYPLDEVKVLAPCTPGKIICVGLNYRDHAEEFGLPVPDEPVLFMKPSTTVIGPGEAIVLPPQSRQVDFEGELAVVIRHRARNISPEEAPLYILGYTPANDVTARDLQKKDGQWTRAKSFDTFCPLGPYIVTDIDPGGLTVSTYLNGVLKQYSSTANFIFDVPTLVSFISGVMTLMPGDVILTGTSGGVGKMVDGDKVEIDIENVGRLMNPVIE
ncbi:2-keto-4-pentenoate hydratase/2-oxohepta-3-ene-1,7-dioic acid hydratase in catechol pathway [Desulfohalotomaculum tongense]|uniref:fumarylacetoacetate hydrolase family protein n=1 Tax=Desulforadius tongensis TaxID=1216062 RepID=UPI001EE5188A|nr:fumarylacetoacetate hydrolase family protein [Desulforadius tongensis]MBM7855891.1 2-keto-4-pentenoate hydratase/2-oxohepta-3-ene-1,7-dioic acid hydratase in catechol pathway [Desulforadius tongensis]